MENSEKILIVIVLVYCLYALIKLEIQKNKITSLKGKVKYYKNKLKI